jgi:hypothetical protein
MHFILGTTLVVATIMLLGFAKYAITRREGSSRIQRFAGTETMALIITTLVAFGVALLCAGLASSSQSALGLTELAVSLGVIAIAVVGVVRAFRRASARAPATTIRAAA